MSDFMTIEQAAAVLGVSQTAVRTAISERRLRTLSKTGGGLIATADLMAYKDEKHSRYGGRYGRPRKGELDQVSE